METTEPSRSRLESRLQTQRTTPSKKDAVEELYSDSMQVKSEDMPFLSFIDQNTTLEGSVFCLTQGDGLSSEELYIEAAIDALNTLEKYDNSATFAIKEVLDYLYLESQLKPQELDQLKRNAQELEEDNEAMRRETEDMEAKKNYYSEESEAIKQRLLKAEDDLAKAELHAQELTTQNSDEQHKLIQLERHIAEMAEETEMAKHNFTLSATRQTHLTAEMTKLRSELEDARATIFRKDGELTFEEDQEKILREEIDYLNSESVEEIERKRAAASEFEEEKSKLEEQLTSEDLKREELEEKLAKEQKRYLNAQIELENLQARLSGYSTDVEQNVGSKAIDISFQEGIFPTLSRDISLTRLPRGSIAATVKEQMQRQASMASFKGTEMRDAKIQVNTLFHRDENAAVPVDYTYIDKESTEDAIEQISESSPFEPLIEFSDYQDLTEINTTAQEYEACFGSNEELKLTNTDIIAVRQYIEQYFVPKDVVDDLKREFEAINCKYARYKLMFYQLEMQRNLNELKGREDSMEESVYNLNEIILSLPSKLDDSTFELMLEINDLKETYIRDMTKNEQKFFDFERIFLQAKQVALEFEYLTEEAENSKLIRSIERKSMSQEILVQSMAELFETLREFQRLPELQHVKVSQLVDTLLPNQRDPFKAEFQAKSTILKPTSPKISKNSSFSPKRNESSSKLTRKNSVRLQSVKTAKFIVGETSLADLLAHNSTSKSETYSMTKPQALGNGQFLGETSPEEKPMLMSQLAQLCETTEEQFDIKSMPNIPPLLMEPLATLREEHISRTEDDKEEEAEVIEEETMTDLTAAKIFLMERSLECEKEQDEERKYELEASNESTLTECFAVNASVENTTKIFEWQEFLQDESNPKNLQLAKIDEETVNNSLKNDNSIKDAKLEHNSDNVAVLPHAVIAAEAAMHEVSVNEAVLPEQVGSILISEEGKSLINEKREQNEESSRSLFATEFLKCNEVAEMENTPTYNVAIQTDTESICVETSESSTHYESGFLSLTNAGKQEINELTANNETISEYEAPIIENLEKPLERESGTSIKINTFKDIQNVGKQCISKATQTTIPLISDIALQTTVEVGMSYTETKMVSVAEISTQTDAFIIKTPGIEISWKKIISKKEVLPEAENSEILTTDSSEFDMLDKRLLLSKPHDNLVMMDPERLIRDDQMDEEIAKLSSRTPKSPDISPPPKLKENEAISEPETICSSQTLSQKEQSSVPTEEKTPCEIVYRQDQDISKINNVIKLLEESEPAFHHTDETNPYYTSDNPEIIVKQSCNQSKAGTHSSPRLLKKVEIQNSPERYRLEHARPLTSSIMYSRSLLEEERQKLFTEENAREVFRILINTAPKQYAIENGRFISPFEKVLSYRRQLQELKRIERQKIDLSKSEEIVEATQIKTQRFSDLSAIQQMQEHFCRKEPIEEESKLITESVIFSSLGLNCPLPSTLSNKIDTFIQINKKCNSVILRPISIRCLTSEVINMKQDPEPNDVVYWMLEVEEFSSTIEIAEEYHRELARQVPNTDLIFIQMPPNTYIRQPEWLLRVIRSIYYEMRPSDDLTITFSHLLAHHILTKYGVKQMAARFIWNLLANLYVYHTNREFVYEIQTFLLFLSDKLDVKAYKYFWYCKKLLIPNEINPELVTMRTALQNRSRKIAEELEILRPFIPDIQSHMIREDIDGTLLCLLAAFAQRNKELAEHVISLFESAAESSFLSITDALRLLEGVNPSLTLNSLTELCSGEQIDLALFCRLYETIAFHETTGSQIMLLRKKLEQTRELILQKRLNGFDEKINTIYLLLYNGQYIDAEIEIDFLFESVIIE